MILERMLAHLRFLEPASSCHDLTRDASNLPQGRPAFDEEPQSYNGIGTTTISALHDFRGTLQYGDSDRVADNQRSQYI